MSSDVVDEEVAGDVVVIADKAELIEFRKHDKAIAELHAKYGALTIKGLSDKEGFEAVHDARMIVRGFRVSIEKRRKALKADALRYGRDVDAAAKHLESLIEPLEKHLTDQEATVTAERERIKKEQEERRRMLLQSRVEKLAAFGITPNLTEVAGMSDEAFEETLTIAGKEHAEKLRKEAEAKAEQERIAAEEKAAKEKAEAEAAEKRRQEEEANRIERERLQNIANAQAAENRRVQAEQAAERKQIEDEKAKLAAERKALEDAENERKRQAELEQARQEAAEKAKKEAEEKAAREHEERLRKEAEEKERKEREAEKVELERLRAEADRPYREKLIAVAHAVAEVELPPGGVTIKVASILTKAANDIMAIANGPLE